MYIYIVYNIVSFKLKSMQVNIENQIFIHTSLADIHNYESVEQNIISEFPARQKASFLKLLFQLPV